ncbi:MAG TPA: hypothetical protein VEP90_04235 [Methylomirabilota bacterium]|nr:hypothetical protein [Methylomirabilota bacterium]
MKVFTHPSEKVGGSLLEIVHSQKESRRGVLNLAHFLRYSTKVVRFILWEIELKKE